MIARYEGAARELKAVAHPLRLAILAAFEKGHNSPHEAFIVLNRTDPQLNLSLVSYHVTELRKAGLVAETETLKVRGATKHVYKVLPSGRKLLQVADTLRDPPCAN